jgi:PAS domain S-box-containing protein
MLVPVAFPPEAFQGLHTCWCDKGESTMSADSEPSKITSAPLHTQDMEGKRLHALLAYTREAVALFDQQMQPLYISSAVEQPLGYAPAKYGTYVSLLHSDDRQPGERLIALLLQTPGESATTQHRVKHQDGTYRWIEATSPICLTIQRSERCWRICKT